MLRWSKTGVGVIGPQKVGSSMSVGNGQGTMVQFIGFQGRGKFRFWFGFRFRFGVQCLCRVWSKTGVRVIGSLEVQCVCFSDGHRIPGSGS